MKHVKFHRPEVWVPFFWSALRACSFWKGPGSSKSWISSFFIDFIWILVEHSTRQDVSSQRIEQAKHWPNWARGEGWEPILDKDSARRTFPWPKGTVDNFRKKSPEYGVWLWAVFCHQIAQIWSYRALVKAVKKLTARSSDWEGFQGLFFIDL